MRLLKAYAPALVWAGIISIAAGASTLPGTPAVPHSDKLAHFGAYAVLGALLGWGWLSAGRRPGRGWLLLFALLLGLSDEVRHAYNPARTAEVADWVADALGAMTGFFLATRVLAWRREDGR